MSVEPSPEERVFLQALREKRGHARDALVADACGNDEALRRRVEALLRSHDEAQGFLETPLIRGTEPCEVPLELQLGSVVGGRYRLDRVLGEGGMAVVFAAEQLSPVQRPVALKVIKPGLDTRQVIARFEAERQALARMTHPSIAGILDGGTTESGRPYFVMERVDGSPITRFCDDAKLPIERRLELFLEVCRAVWHAHQKGVIHRDLKPSNVLVAMNGQTPMPKVIDFGIAKAIDQRLTNHTVETGRGVFLGTPEYMSPEQADSARDLDTRADVFSLGVLLCELLTGSTQLDPARLRELAYDRLLVAVREREPSRPSTRVRSMGDVVEGLARTRRTTPNRLHKTLRGDLDWIVVKAMQNDRSQRYGGAGLLIEDVQRYLAGDAVSAGPPNPIYRWRRSIRRHRPLVAAALLVVAALFVGLGVAVWKAADERNARVAAEQSRRQADAALVRSESLRRMLSRMVSLAEPRPGRSPDYTVVEMLADFGDDIDQLTSTQPDVAAELYTTVGGALRALGLREEAATHFEAALVLRRSIATTTPVILSEAILDVVRAGQALAQVEDGRWLKLTEEALTLSRSPGGRPTATTARALETMGYVHHASQRNSAALQWFQQALDVAERLDDQPRMIRLHAALASAYNSAGYGDLSIAHAGQGAALAEVLYTESSDEFLRAKSMLASSLSQSGDAAAGCAMQAEVIATRQSLGAPISVWSLRSLERGVLRLQRQGRATEAATFHALASEWFDTVPDESRTADWGFVARDLAVYHFGIGEDDRSRERLHEAIGLYLRANRMMAPALAASVYLSQQPGESNTAARRSNTLEVVSKACQRLDLRGYGLIASELLNALRQTRYPTALDPITFVDLAEHEVDQIRLTTEAMFALQYALASPDDGQRDLVTLTGVLAELLAELRPERPDGPLLLAVCRYRQDRYDEAFSSLDLAAAMIGEGDHGASIMLGVYRALAFTATGRHEEAATAFRTVEALIDDQDVAIPELAMHGIDEFQALTTRD